MIEIKYSNFKFDDQYKSAQDSVHLISNQIINSIESDTDTYKILSIDHARKQSKYCAAYANKIRDNFSDLIIIGMGGSILNPESIISLLADNNAPTKVHFLHNTDPLFLHNLLAKISLKNCAVLVISNSGNTLETVSLAGVMISEFTKANITELGKHFYFITNNKSGKLHGLAKKLGAKLIDHTENISGRYSGLTNVTTLAAQIAGIDAGEYLDGAKLALDDFFSLKEKSLAGLSAAALYSSNKSISVNIGYLQQFSPFLEWYSQIIAESLGKNGKGITPVYGLGPNDQHSMLQLYLDGPKDKIYNLFYINNDNITYTSCDFAELGYMANKNLSDINRANFDATLNALIKTNNPTRSIIVKELSAKSMGFLVAHSMIEVIILGHLMQINPFNQPDVESIKTEALRIVSSF